MNMISKTYKVIGYLMLVMIVLQLFRGTTGWYTPINILTGMLFIGIGNWLQDGEDCGNERK